MKKLALAALGAAMMAGSLVATTAPADARVSVGIGIGIPGGFYGPGPAYYGPRPGRACDPYSYYYDPYRCDEERYYGDTYYDPIFFGGEWYRGPFRYRDWHGSRWFWVNGGWHRNEGGGGRFGGGSFHGGWHGGGGGHWNGGSGGSGGHWNGGGNGGWHHH